MKQQSELGISFDHHQVAGSPANPSLETNRSMAFFSYIGGYYTLSVDS
jgi:hypothetical protein